MWCVLTIYTTSKTFDLISQKKTLFHTEYYDYNEFKHLDNTTECNQKLIEYFTKNNRTELEKLADECKTPDTYFAAGYSYFKSSRIYEYFDELDPDVALDLLQISSEGNVALPNYSQAFHYFEKCQKELDVCFDMYAYMMYHGIGCRKQENRAVANIISKDTFFSNIFKGTHSRTIEKVMQLEKQFFILFKMLKPIEEKTDDYDFIYSLSVEGDEIKRRLKSKDDVQKVKEILQSIRNNFTFNNKTLHEIPSESKLARSLIIYLLKNNQSEKALQVAHEIPHRYYLRMCYERNVPPDKNVDMEQFLKGNSSRLLYKILSFNYIHPKKYQLSTLLYQYITKKVDNIYLEDLHDYLGLVKVKNDDELTKNRLLYYAKIARTDPNYAVVLGSLNSVLRLNNKSNGILLYIILRAHLFVKHMMNYFDKTNQEVLLLINDIKALLQFLSVCIIAISFVKLMKRRIGIDQLFEPQ